MTSSSKPFDIAALDSLTGGAFQAVTSGERSARLREWLLSEPTAEVLAEVYRELSTRDKGAAKLLKEKLDELKRVHGQEALASDWAQKAEQLLQAPRLNIADAMAWQRDAAKAGAPLSREPLASLKLRLAEVVKGVEDLQHQVMVQREAAVLLAQRIEVLSTKPVAEAHAGLAGLQSDVGQWQAQAQQLTTNAVWPSVDMKFPAQLDAALSQLQAVWQGFSAALALAQQAQADATAALPSVPVWADEIRRLRGEVVAEVHAPAAGATEAEAAKEPKAAKPKMDAAQRQALREQANQAVTDVLEALEKHIAEGQMPADAALALRAVLKAHGKNLDTALDERVHNALTAAGDTEGWQRWLADQVRQDLVAQAEGLLDAEKVPTVGGRKMQDKLRQLRDSWKQTDQGGLPNHALWKRFDAACNEAYKAVLAWLEQMKKESADHRAQRVALLDEVKAWTVAHAESDDWRAQLRALHQFADRWRNAGHLSEKAFGEMQSQWKAVLKAAAARLEAAQKASVERRQALINEAREVGAAPALRVDAVKALQQRWQVEAQSVPLDRKTEQKLWEVFRAPLDEAFQRKGTDRQASSAPLSARDRAVIDASKALDEANAGGDAAKIRAAMAALDAALRGQAQEVRAQEARIQEGRTQEAQPLAASVTSAPVAASSDASAEGAPVADTSAAEANAAAAAPADSSEAGSDRGDAVEAPVAEVAPVAPPKPAKPVVAVRGDDRPGQKKTEAVAAGRDGRRDGRPGDRNARPGGDRGPGRGGERTGDRFGDRGARGDGRDVREDRGPRLGDAAFRAQREAMERAEMSLRKLAAQAHGETLTRLMTAWQERQADALPSAQELGRGINAATRQAWAQAVSAPAQTPAATALLRLEMAAEVPTPADNLNERRALQLQLLTQRNQPGPNETWGQDVAQVLSGPHEAATARRLQNVLKNLLRG